MSHEKSSGVAAIDPACEGLHLGPVDAATRRRGLVGARTVEALAETFRALGDPTRVRMLDALGGGELCVCDIASLVGISESAASHQLRLLRGMRLVRPRRAGRLVYYAVDDHHILELLAQARTHVEEEQLAGRDPRGAADTPPLEADIPSSESPVPKREAR
jgi:ArsR family transcriptional regulator, lead/cadmium/zinc/bismuth-responsive transcriptional repressor